MPAERLLGGTEGRGFAQLMGDLPYERLIVAVQAVATMEGAIKETVAYVKGRRAFGKSLLEFQNARFRLAEAATITRVARTFIDRSIEQQLAGPWMMSPPRWPSTGPPTCCRRWWMSACSCTAATAT